MIRTFLDSGVLIAAFRVVDPKVARALKVLDDPNRIFLTSAFIYLEVVPKAVFHGKWLERSFYDRYFQNSVWFRETAKIEAAAQTEAAKNRLGAMDVLHMAVAYLSHADEFITTEKPSKPIHRSSLVPIVYLFG